MQNVDAIVRGGPILTMAGERPAYVEALAIRDGKIAFEGGKDETLHLADVPSVFAELKRFAT